MYVAMDTACFLRYEAQLVVAITSVCFFKVWSPVCGCYYHCLVFKHWSILLAHLVWCHLSTGRREACMSPCPSVDVNICRPQIAFLRAHWFSQNPQTKKKGFDYKEISAKRLVFPPSLPPLPRSPFRGFAYWLGLVCLQVRKSLPAEVTIFVSFARN